MRTQSSIKYILPQWACTAASKTKEYIEYTYLQFFQEINCAHIYSMDDRISTEQMKRSKVSVNEKLWPYLWGTETVFSSLTRITSFSS